MSRLAVGKRRTSLLAASQRPTEKYPHGRTCGSAALPPLMRPTTGLVPPRHAVASVVQKFMADMFQACTYVQTCSGICARRVPADNYATMSEAKTVYCVPFASILDGTTRRANLHQSPSPGTVHPEHSVYQRRANVFCCFHPETTSESFHTPRRETFYRNTQRRGAEHGTHYGNVLCAPSCLRSPYQMTPKRAREAGASTQLALTLPSPISIYTHTHTHLKPLR